MTVLYTHSDFDGIACAVLISSVEEVSEIRFAEPSEIQKRELRVLPSSIISDLPFHPEAAKWFDHHESAGPPKKFEGSFVPSAKSCARVVLDYYDNPFLEKKFSEFVKAVDKIDSAGFTKKDVKNPSGYYLLCLSLDALEKAAEAKAYRLLLIDLLKTLPLEKILSHPKVKPKTVVVLERLARLEKVLPQYTKLIGKVAVIDFRNAPDWVKRSGGRFLVYLQQPGCVASLRVRVTRADNADFSIGENIFSRKLKTNLGKIAGEFGGGGHFSAAGFQIKQWEADAAIARVAAKINSENK